jgi:hypothetical protein
MSRQSGGNFHYQNKTDFHFPFQEYVGTCFLTTMFLQISVFLDIFRWNCPTFQRNMSPQSSNVNLYCFLLFFFLFALFFQPTDRSDIFFRSFGLIFNELHGVISKKIRAIHNHRCEILISYMQKRLSLYKKVLREFQSCIFWDIFKIWRCKWYFPLRNR